MDRNDIILIVVFISLVGGLVYLLGASLTGFVTQTMYCEDGKCSKFCKFDHECMDDSLICCYEQGAGVCREKSECRKAFTYNPERPSAVEMPTPVSKFRILIFMVTLLAVLIAGPIYFLKRKGKKPDFLYS